MNVPKPLIIVLCTGNSCRSQMAEGFLREALGEHFEIASAGTKPAGYVHPEAIACMAELGIDLSSHRSKHLNEFLDSPIDGAITVCDHAASDCPELPDATWRLHWSFSDPAAPRGDYATVGGAFRDVRDGIRRTVEAYASGYRRGRCDALDSNDRRPVSWQPGC